MNETKELSKMVTACVSAYEDKVGVKVKRIEFDFEFGNYVIVVENGRERTDTTECDTD